MIREKDTTIFLFTVSSDKSMKIFNVTDGFSCVQEEKDLGGPIYSIDIVKNFESNDIYLLQINSDLYFYNNDFKFMFSVPSIASNIGSCISKVSFFL
jgi:hypothetical protein